MGGRGAAGAGLPVQVGLYVATVPMLVYALAGTSRARCWGAGVLRLGFAADFISAPVLAVVVSMLTLIHGANHPTIEVLGRRPGGGHWRSLDRHPDG
jgi:MFS superfamily sulfate permease-like transporter